MRREAWRDNYDTRNCPRGDGGSLRDEGEVVNRPGESPTRFFSCSTCCKWWTVIELRRLTPGPALRATT